MPALELTAGFYMLACMIYCLYAQKAMALPFLALFVIGYFYVGLTSILSRLAGTREVAGKKLRESPQLSKDISSLPPAA